ncbi:MAG TPA: hypothetical protein VFP34_20070, partial [Microlunatus sp.]|nr:hypothetical protein [Microlunatus sp.]
WDLLYDLSSKGVTLFVTTHYMDEASHCDRLAFIYRGGVIAQGSPQEIRDQVADQEILEIDVSDPDAALDVIIHVPGVRDAYLSAAAVHVVIDLTQADHDRVVDSLTSALRGSGFGEPRISTVPPTVEDAFVALVSRNDG